MQQFISPHCDRIFSKLFYSIGMENFYFNYFFFGPAIFKFNILQKNFEFASFFLLWMRKIWIRKKLTRSQVKSFACDMKNFWVWHFFRHTCIVFFRRNPNARKRCVNHKISTNDIDYKIISNMQMTQKSNANANAQPWIHHKIHSFIHIYYFLSLHENELFFCVITINAGDIICPTRNWILIRWHDWKK